MKGRKRHIVVDGLGLVLGCYVTAANTADVKENHEGMIYVVMVRLMLRRLAKNRRTWKPKND